MSPNKALRWVIFWICVALAFNVFVYVYYGHHKGIEFFTGYLIEESLSVDNLFVFLMLFRYFKIDKLHQRKVLNWGIIGVIILRGIFILSGTALVARFEYVLYIFGAILIFSGINMAFKEERTIHPEKNKVLKFFKRFMKTTNEPPGGKFIIKKNGESFATTLLVCLIVIESTDIIFAIDSIPAIFAITTDPFIIFSSNILAVLGLRSFYFVISAIADKFEYVKKGVGTILCYIGVKMLLPIVLPSFKMPIFISLMVIVSALGISVLFSLVLGNRRGKSKI